MICVGQTGVDADAIMIDIEHDHDLHIETCSDGQCHYGLLAGVDADIIVTMCQSHMQC